MSRYSTSAVRRLWTPDKTLDLWRDVELAILEAQGRSGIVPMDWLRENANWPRPSVDAWQRWESETEHEVVAFLMAWDPPRPIHIGVTSSDIVDTANALRFKEWRDFFRTAANNLTGDLFTWAMHQNYQILTRTHGRPALIENAKDVWMHWVAMIERAVRHAYSANTDMLTCKVSGPVGINNDAVSEDVERLVAEMFGLTIDHNPSQIVSRDIYGRWAFAMAQVVKAIEAMATQFRLHGLVGVDEYHEGRGPLTVGSSSLPRKKNPITLERLTGISRMAEALVMPINDGMVQWHQRDLAQSSVERTLLPQLMGLTHYAILTFHKLVHGIEVHNENIGQMTWIDQTDDNYMKMTTAMKNGATYKEAREQAG